ncbi:MAG: hypothetical protein KDB90_15300 [Planctomycetes bacterium]|nr:hypothetical protein [Planctomycetota bacterium]
MFANDVGSVADRVLVTPTVAIGTGTHTLTFNLSYATESGFDGCVLEIDVGVTGTFSDIITAGGTFNANGYNGTISTSFSSPILGRSAWTGNSGGYVAVDVTLPASAASSNVQLRWRMASDSSIGSTGVDLDDVLLVGPAGPVSAPAITSSAPTNAFVGTTYSYTVTATGSPAPTFGITGTLPAWLTWDGTDTLSGTPAAGDVGTVGPLTITATNTAGTDTEVFSITVSPSAPEIDIQDPNATAVASGSTVGVYAALVATASTGNFNIDNNGNVTLNITSTTTTNMVNCTTSNTGPGATIAASGSDTLAISVTPTAAGAFSFTVTIVNNDSDEGTYVLNFAGEAKAAADNEIVVLNPTGGDIANGGTLSENNTGTLAFNRAFTVRNIGGTTLTLSGGPIAISALNNCTVTPTQPASSSLGGAGTWLPTDEAFSLNITPTAAGAFSFLVTIGNDDADEAPFTFTFSGNTAGGGSGGGGGGGGGGCSTDSSNGLSIFALLGILSMLAISIRMRGSKA